MKKKMPLLVLSLLFLLLFTTCTHENNNQQVILNAVKDVDGNSYDAVRIGDQVWMKTNLRTKHFRNGNAIAKGNAEINSMTDAYYYEPNTTELLEYDSKTYGLYYNWPAAIDNRGICPKGWHVPSHEEWAELQEYVSDKSEYLYNNKPKSIAKALATKTGWKSSDEEGTPGLQSKLNNATGFSAFPTGLWIHGWSFQNGAEHGSFVYDGEIAFFWSSTSMNSVFAPMGCEIDYDEKEIKLSMAYDVDEWVWDGIEPEDGGTIRCVRDK